MKRSKYSESQIVGTLNEADPGLKVVEVCRKYKSLEIITYFASSRFTDLYTLRVSLISLR